MDYNESSLSQTFGRHVDPTKPQLPNFDHFVRTVGQPDLAFRSSQRLDSTCTSSPTGQTSLPTPPATSGHQFGWLAGEMKRDFQNDHQSAIVDDNDIPTVEPHRRASFVQHDRTRPQPRPVRSYSSVQGTLNTNGTTTWRPSHVINEQEIPGKGLCYVYDDGTVCPKEVNGYVVNPKWGTTKAGRNVSS